MDHHQETDRCFFVTSINPAISPEVAIPVTKSLKQVSSGCTQTESPQHIADKQAINNGISTHLFRPMQETGTQFWLIQHRLIHNWSAGSVSYDKVRTSQ